ncbi:LlaJI family restriction endonuclease [Methanobrevibacter millerae]|uniref:Type II restriction endonuclease n=1 Tax=Methanobrevibacter millerae TaxID=230361 RepID=A0A0U3E9H9_9EURY|nr:LlaJI family restriction endonuclease [Methanobrevibacter millerae]ALT68984.1 type II restriction endonuclease [Methanobrevibacter millerae]
MTQTDILKKYCRIATNRDNDRFVGIHGDDNGVFVYFPLGYELSETDSEIRRDIFHLFEIINEFKEEKEGNISQRNNSEKKDVEFPIGAYMEIIYYFLNNGYYRETDSVYRTQNKGKVNWSKTIKKQNPILIKNKNSSYSLIYANFTVRNSTPNDDKEITRINQYCVYESFKKIGWLFNSYMPPKPIGKLNKNKSLFILQDKLSNTNVDNKKKLFKSMIDLINSMDDNSENQFYYGTNTFEHVFEKMVDKMFGIEHKDDYYPKAEWNLKFNDNIKTYPLQPDTIMEYDDKIFVIDSKYYKYGDTAEPKDLPQITSINKQITYAEYAKTLEITNNKEIYNAFLLPFNKESKKFSTNNLINVGEAIGEWRGKSTHKYEHVQCVLIDVRYLMENYKVNSKDNIIQLANAIEEAFEETVL